MTIQALGLILIQPLGWGSMLIEFDHAVGLWRHQLRDWLSVIAEGPTDFLEPPVRGETRWAEEGYTNEVWELLRQPPAAPASVAVAVEARLGASPLG